MVPSPVATVTTAFEMPSGWQRHERELAFLSVAEKEANITSSERLDWTPAIPLKLLLSVGKTPTGIALRAERENSLATQIAVFARSAFDEAPVKSMVAKLCHRPAEQKRCEHRAGRIAGISAQRTPRTPRAVAVSPPVALLEQDSFAADFQGAGSAANLIKARDILHHPATALAGVVFLFERVHRGRPFQIQPEGRGIVVQPESKPFQPFEHFDLKRTDFYLVNSWSQAAGRSKVILLASIPDRGEAILHVFVRILAHAETNDRILVSYVVNADVDALRPLRIVRVHMVHGLG